MKTIQAIVTRTEAALSQFWRELRCGHSWTPVHHSYRCVKCGKLDCDF